MNAKELEQIRPSSVRKGTRVILDDHIKGKENTVFTYHFAGQKESHLTVPTKEWNKFVFELEEDTVYITKYAYLTIIQKENGWKRLAVKEDDNDE